MITTPEASAKQDNTVNEANNDNKSSSISQDHVVRKRIISKSVLGLISLFMLVPILIVLLSWTQPVADIWTHMRQYVLPQVLKNTVILLLMVTLRRGRSAVPITFARTRALRSDLFSSLCASELLIISSLPFQLCARFVRLRMRYLYPCMALVS